MRGFIGAVSDSAAALESERGRYVIERVPRFVREVIAVLLEDVVIVVVLCVV